MRDQNVLSFSHGAHNVSTVFSKVHEFVQNRSFASKITTFCHFRTRRTTFQRLSAKCTSLYKTAFSALDQHVLSVSHWVHYFLAIFNKLDVIVQNSEFSPRSACFVISALGEAFFSQSERVCAKQRFEPEIRTFSHFRHWAHHFLAVFRKVH